MRQTFSFLLIILSINNVFASSDLDSLLQVLEKEMAQREIYRNAKQLRIDNLKNFLNEKNIELEQVYYLNKRLVNEYITFSFDSTLFYLNKNLKISEKLGNQEYINDALLVQSYLFASSGRYKEAEDVLKELNLKTLSEKLKLEYFNCYKLIYAELGSFSLVSEKKSDYFQLFLAYSDSFLNLAGENTEIKLRVLEEKARLEKDLMNAKQYNSRRLLLAKMGERNYSIVCYERSLLYEMEQDTENQKKYLCLSAISDIRGAILDNASLTTLALLLKNEKHVDQAFRYINFAFEDAVRFNSRLRFLRISEVFPTITASYESKNEKFQNRLTIFLIVISILSLGLILSIFYNLRQIKNLSVARNNLLVANQQLSSLNTELNANNLKYIDLNDKLIESNHVKEQYIASFLTRCSNYIDKLEEHRKMVKKMIIGRKISELLDKTNSKLAIKEEINEFYKNFDSTFLSIYPRFVDEINVLIDPNEQFILENKDFLNTELRIFALIRLGVSDSSKIAKLLRYSVNTIYNYRVKVKNKAIVPRDEFEERIMKIGINY